MNSQLATKDGCLVLLDSYGSPVVEYHSNWCLSAIRSGELSAQYVHGMLHQLAQEKRLMLEEDGLWRKA